MQSKGKKLPVHLNISFIFFSPQKNLHIKMQTIWEKNEYVFSHSFVHAQEKQYLLFPILVFESITLRITCLLCILAPIKREVIKRERNIADNNFFLNITCLFTLHQHIHMHIHKNLSSLKCFHL